MPLPNDGRKISEMVLATPLQGLEYFEIIQKDTGGEWKNRKVRLDTISQFTGGAATPGADGASAYEIAVASGYTGTEQEWLDSLHGVDGASAYEVAIANGFTGTEAEWLASLEGPQGEQGLQGDPGTDGIDGQSAYELAVAEGFTGTLQEWLTSLEGTDGQSAEFRIQSGWLEARVGDGTWSQVLDLSTLTPTNTVVSSDGSIVDIQTVTQVEYDALSPPDPSVMYIISDADKGPPDAVILDPVVVADEVGTGKTATIDRSRGHIHFLTVDANTTVTFSMNEGDNLTVHVLDGDAHIVVWDGVHWVGIPQAPGLSPHNVLEFWKGNGQIYGGHPGQVYA